VCRFLRATSPSPVATAGFRAAFRPRLEARDRNQNGAGSREPRKLDDSTTLRSDPLGWLSPRMTRHNPAFRPPQIPSCLVGLGNRVGSVHRASDGRDSILYAIAPIVQRTKGRTGRLCVLHEGAGRLQIHFGQPQVMRRIHDRPGRCRPRDFDSGPIESALRSLSEHSRDAPHLGCGAPGMCVKPPHFCRSRCCERTPIPASPSAGDTALDDPSRVRTHSRRYHVTSCHEE